MSTCAGMGAHYVIYNCQILTALRNVSLFHHKCADENHCRAIGYQMNALIFKNIALINTSQTSSKRYNVVFSTTYL